MWKSPCYTHDSVSAWNFGDVVCFQHTTLELLSIMINNTQHQVKYICFNRLSDRDKTKCNVLMYGSEQFGRDRITQWCGSLRLDDRSECVMITRCLHLFSYNRSLAHSGTAPLDGNKTASGKYLTLGLSLQRTQCIYLSDLLSV